MTEWGDLVHVGAGVVMAGMGTWLLLLRDAAAPARAMGVFLVARGVFNASIGFGYAFYGQDPWPIPLHRTWNALSAIIPLLVIGVLAVFPRRRWWWRPPRIASAVLAAVVIGIGTAVFVRPDLVGRSGDGLGDAHLLWWFPALLLPLYGMAALVLARDRERMVGAPLRASITLVTAGFLWDTLYLGARNTSSLALHLYDGAYQPGIVVWATALIPAIAATVLLTRGLHRDKDVARWQAPVLAIAAGASLAAGVARTLARNVDAPMAVQAATAFDGVFVLTMPAFLTYGILRNRLFGIDLAIKRVVGPFVVGAVFVGLLYGAARLFEDQVTAATTIVVVLAVVVIFAVNPLHRLGSWASERLLPGVRSTPEYMDHRKLEVYQSTLEQVLGPDGEYVDGGRERIERLRGELDLTARDHAVLRQALRMRAKVNEDHAELTEGTVLCGRYRLGPVLGRGGQGTTFLAHDVEEDEAVVVKTVRPFDAQRGDLRETAATLQRVRHPNVVELRSIEEAGGQLFIAMEHVGGGTLKEKLDGGPMASDAWPRVARDLLSGLGAVHDAGLVHRDVKPSNVLLTSDGTAKVSDFGIATAVADDTTIVVGGDEGIEGTLRYMSPEQARGAKVDERSDLYSAALTVLEAATGRPRFPPVPGETPYELRLRAADPGELPEDVGLAPEARAWFERALAVDADARFSSAAEMEQALVETLGGVTA